MSDPDQLAAETRTTQDALGKDVARLSDRVSPEKIVGTRREKITHSFSAIKDQVMGIGDSAAQAAKDGAKSAAGSAQDAATSAQNAGGGSGNTSDAVRDKAQGNPVAAGLIAFGAGWLLSSLAPASDAEKKAASKVEEHAADPLKQSAQEVAGNLKEPAQQAARSVQDTTTDAANRTAEHAKSATSDVQDHAKDAKGDVTSNGNGNGPGSYGGHYAG